MTFKTHVHKSMNTDSTCLVVCRHQTKSYKLDSSFVSKGTNNLKTILFPQPSFKLANLKTGKPLCSPEEIWKRHFKPVDSQSFIASATVRYNESAILTRVLRGWRFCEICFWDFRLLSSSVRFTLTHDLLWHGRSECNWSGEAGNISIIWAWSIILSNKLIPERDRQIREWLKWKTKLRKNCKLKTHHYHNFDTIYITLYNL